MCPSFAFPLRHLASMLNVRRGSLQTRCYPLVHLITMSQQVMSTPINSLPIIFSCPFLVSSPNLRLSSSSFRKLQREIPTLTMTDSPPSLGNFSYPPGTGIQFNYMDSVVTTWTTFDPNATACLFSLWYWVNSHTQPWTVSTSLDFCS